jgi:hypothetical protein
MFILLSLYHLAFLSFVYLYIYLFYFFCLWHPTITTSIDAWCWKWKIIKRAWGIFLFLCLGMRNWHCWFKFVSRGNKLFLSCSRTASWPCWSGVRNQTCQNAVTNLILIILLENVAASRLIKKFRTLLGIRRCITVLRTTRQWPLL